MFNKSVLIIMILICVSMSFSLTLKVGVYDNYPLIYYDTVQKSPSGLFIDLLNYIAKENDWNLVYVYGTWQDLFNDLKSGKIDVLGDVAYSKNREKYIKYSDFTITYNWGVLCKKAFRKDIYDIFDLEGKSVALVDDIYYSFLKSQADKFNVNLQFKIVSSYAKALDELKKGNVDFAVVNRYYALANLNKYTNIQMTSFIFSPIKLRFAFKNDISSAFVKNFDKNLLELTMKQDSYYYQTIRKYLSKLQNQNSVPRWIYLLLMIVSIGGVSLLFVIYVLRKIINSKTKEIRQKNLELLAKRREVEASYEELQAMNEELEHSYSELDKYAATLSDIYNVVSKIGYEKISIDDISSEILRIALDAVEEADTGSISHIENGIWKFLATVGHDKDKLNSLNIPAKYFIKPDKPTLINNIQQENLSRMPKDLFEAFKSATIPITKTILSPIKIGTNIKGNLALDILDEEKAFSNNSLKIVKAVSAIGSAFLTMNSYAKLQGELQKDVVLTLIRILEIFDPYTEGHSEFVADYSAKLAQFLGLSKPKVKMIYWAGLVHDIGKIGIPKEVLNKPGPLTNEEYELIKQHPILGHDLLASSEKLKDIAKIVRHHHERFDGRGYPDGISSDNIPFESRILTVVDTWHAMTSDRPYRKALGFEVAFSEIEKGKGTQFDPIIADEFLKMISKRKI